MRPGARPSALAALAALAVLAGCGRSGFSGRAADGAAADRTLDRGAEEAGGPDDGDAFADDRCTTALGVEACNGMDDDCDGRVDEAPAPGEHPLCEDDGFCTDDGDCRGATEWLHVFGGVGADLLGGAAGLADGTVVVVGAYDAALPFDAAGGHVADPVGGKDGFVVAFDDSGGYAWHLTVASAGADEVLDVAALGEDRILVGGSYSGAVTLASGLLPSPTGSACLAILLDASGVVLDHWAPTAVAGSCQGAHVALSTDRHAYLAARFRGTMDFGGGLRTSALSESVVVVALGGDVAEGRLTYLWDVALAEETPEGYVFATDLAATNMGPAWSGAYGGAVTVGLVEHHSEGLASDGLLVALDTDGLERWSRAIPDGLGGVSHVGGLSWNLVSGFYAVGAAVGAPDLGGGPVAVPGLRAALFASYAHDGAYRSAALYGADASYGSVDAYPGLAIPAPGTPVACAAGEYAAIDLGRGRAEAEGTADGVVACHGPSGPLWWRLVTGSGRELVAVAASSLTADRLVVAGQFDGDLAAGAGVRVLSAGAEDLFVARLRH